MSCLLFTANPFLVSETSFDIHFFDIPTCTVEENGNISCIMAMMVDVVGSLPYVFMQVLPLSFPKINMTFVPHLLVILEKVGV